MGLVVQIILASVYIIVVECHFSFLNKLGIPTVHTIIHGQPENQHRWHHNIFNPSFPNRQPNNYYNSDDIGYGHEVSDGSNMHHGTIMTYDNYGSGNGMNTPLDERETPEHPHHYDLNNHNVNGDQNNHGSGEKHNSEHPDDISHYNNAQPHESTDETQKNNSENNTVHGNKVDTESEKEVTNDVGYQTDKKKLLEDVVINQDPNSSKSNGNQLNTNSANANGNPIYLSPSKIIQNIPGVANAIIVPLPNTGGIQLNPAVQIVGTDTVSGLPVVNVNGALYYYMSPANNQVTTTTQKPTQIIVLPTNGPKPLVNVGTGQINTVPTNPNYIILNSNGQLLQPVNSLKVPIETETPQNNGIRTNGAVSIGDITSYLQQHPEVLQPHTNTASVAPNSQNTPINPANGGANSNTINNGVGTPNNASPVGYQPIQNVGSQTNNGMTSNQAAIAIISFILQHPEIFGLNTVSNNVPNSIPNAGLSYPNTGQGSANINPTNVMPNNAIDTSGTGSPNANQPVQNTGSGDQANNRFTPNDVQGIITFLTQHPEIFPANAVVSNSAPNLNGNGTPNTQPNLHQDNRNNFLPSNEPNGAIGVSNNVKVPVNDKGPDPQVNNGIPTNEAPKVGDIINYLTQHPEIYGPITANNTGNNPIDSRGSNGGGNNSNGGNINSNIVQRSEISGQDVTTVSPSSGNGNMPSYLLVQGPGDQTTNPQPNNSGSGEPPRTNLLNNDGNNNNADNNTPLAVLALGNTKELEGIKFNKKVGDQDLPKKVDTLSAAKDNNERDAGTVSGNIIPTQVPAAGTV